MLGFLFCGNYIFVGLEVFSVLIITVLISSVLIKIATYAHLVFLLVVDFVNKMLVFFGDWFLFLEIHLGRSSTFLIEDTLARCFGIDIIFVLFWVLILITLFFWLMGNTIDKANNVTILDLIESKIFFLLFEDDFLTLNFLFEITLLFFELPNSIIAIFFDLLTLFLKLFNCILELANSVLVYILVV